MESAMPHTGASVLLSHVPGRAAELPCYCDYYKPPCKDPSHGFNSSLHRHVEDCCESSWLDPAHVPDCAMSRDHPAMRALHQRRGYMEVKHSRRPRDFDGVWSGRTAGLRGPCNGRCSCEVKHEIVEQSAANGNGGVAIATKKVESQKVESVSEFMQAITASFIRFIFENGSPAPRRVIWFIIWVTCCGYALSNINAALTQYFSFETSSQLSFSQKTGGNLSMPAITICNMNKYRKSWLLKSENSVVKKYEEERVWGPEVLAIMNRSITAADDEAAKKILVDDLERTGKHDIRDMFHEMVFDEEDLLAGNILDHLTEQSTELGICYTFNTNGTKKVKRTGADYGATFTININQDEYADTQESAGIKVMLHHFKEPPLIKEYGMAIPPGSEAYISTRTLELHSIGEPYANSNCTSRPLRTTDYYSVVGCTLECHARILDQACKCKQSHMPIDNITICNLYEHRICTEEEIKRIHKGLYGDKIRDCWCIDACSSTSYEYSLSRAEYPSLNAARNILADKMIPNFTKISDLRENYIRLHVYFETLAIEKVQKVAAYTTMNLLGDVGGNLGLFIGANVATLAEIIDYMARMVYSWWSSRRNPMRAVSTTGSIFR